MRVEGKTLKIEQSQDERRYRDYVQYCRRVEIEPASFERWMLISRRLPDPQ